MDWPDVRSTLGTALRQRRRPNRAHPRGEAPPTGLFQIFVFPQVRTPCGHGAQVIVEGREKQSDGGERNKDHKHNPKTTTKGPQAESPPSCRLSSVLGETVRRKRVSRKGPEFTNEKHPPGFFKFVTHEESIVLCLHPLFNISPIQGSESLQLLTPAESTVACVTELCRDDCFLEHNTIEENFFSNLRQS